MNFINEGPNYEKGYRAYDISLADAVTGETIAWYTGYYNAKTKKIKLYPNRLTDYGKEINYKLELMTISASQVKYFD